MSPVMNPVFISSTLQPLNKSKPPEDPKHFRYVLTQQLHACDCAKEVRFCGLPGNSNFETFLGNLPCCFCLGLYIFHQRKMINPSWILNQINRNKTEWQSNILHAVCAEICSWGSVQATWKHKALQHMVCYTIPALAPVKSHTRCFLRLSKSDSTNQTYKLFPGVQLTKQITLNPSK